MLDGPKEQIRLNAQYEGYFAAGRCAREATAGDLRLALLTGTIRGRILCAFLVMSVITAALGGYAALGIREPACWSPRRSTNL